MFSKFDLSSCNVSLMMLSIQVMLREYYLSCCETSQAALKESPCGKVSKLEF